MYHYPHTTETVCLLITRNLRVPDLTAIRLYQRRRTHRGHTANGRLTYGCRHGGLLIYAKIYKKTQIST